MAFAIAAEFNRNDIAHITCMHSVHTHIHTLTHTETHSIIVICSLSHNHIDAPILHGEIIMTIDNHNNSFIATLSSILSANRTLSYMFYFIYFWLTHYLNFRSNQIKSTMILWYRASFACSLVANEQKAINANWTTLCQITVLPTFRQQTHLVWVTRHRAPTSLCIRHFHVFHFRKSLKFICSWTRNDLNTGFENDVHQFFFTFF